ncbi:acyl-CoA dehydrogenase family protein [Streptosporangium sp. NBC_01755]|uniref:acyl-CoA dehydrogenase family protein n=1 Tax=unclassified Streptosporangium TaxID=2632669 RepID=UPI002DDC5CBA|nr:MULTISPECIES: acyl-CoA dehydrogenase family protein [unclassified Streptosporangium]WSA28288.1 acyl-CoA dehydrogenase family protein [Streptosporangium sp. NBC_01810]WSD00235.1 acyl-CoA dehydrogenase family protein [Streptosporangium sp. NBC_01755]
MWSFETDAEFQAELDWMKTFVDEKIVPIESHRPDRQEFAELIVPLQETVKQRGLWAAHLSPELGGRGFGQLKLGLMHEIIGRCVVAPYVFGNQAPDSGNSEILALHATEQQREQWLVPLLDGRIRSSYAMTEPGAGADPTLLATRATQVEGGWRLDGEKWFITNASAADFMIVMAVTDPDARPHERASQFIVPTTTPGLKIVREIGTLEDSRPEWGRLENHSEVILQDVRVGADAMLGPRGQGFRIAQERLGPGRIHHCMRWIGQAGRALELLCARALTRYSHGSLLSDKQTVQNWIAESWADLHAARLMTLHAAWKIDNYGVKEARTEISAIKFRGAQMLHDVIDRAMQVHGALGLTTDLPLQDMYRRARSARIYDGPDEVHRQSVARAVLKSHTATHPVPSATVPETATRAH